MRDNKSNLMFLNALRNLPIFPLGAPREERHALDPIKQGKEGDEHWARKAKLRAVEPEPNDEPDLKAEEEAEVGELLGDFEAADEG